MRNFFRNIILNILSLNAIPSIYSANNSSLLNQNVYLKLGISRNNLLIQLSSESQSSSYEDTQFYFNFYNR